MPIVKVEMLEGRSAEVKQRLAAEITDSVARCTGAQPEHIYVMFTDVARENWAVSGQLFSHAAPK